MLFYPAALPLSRQTLTYVARIICRHRSQTGSPWRKLNPAQQALLVLAYLASRGHTPVVTVSGKGSGRVSVAGLACYRPGERSRLFYRARIHRGAKASATRCPKPITPDWSPPRTSNCMPRSS